MAAYLENMSMTTTAEQFAAKFGNDGQRWATDNGTEFESIADKMGARITFAVRSGNDDHGNPEYADGFFSDHMSGDPVRYEFPDGSAIVAAGDAWDIEGDSRFSWAGA